MFWGLKFELLKLKIHQNAKLLLYMTQMYIQPKWKQFMTLAA